MIEALRANLVAPARRRVLGGLCAALLAGCAGFSLAASTPAAAEEVKFSEAETLLWMTDQLRAIKAPTVITYSFVKDGSYEEGFEDRVEFTISKVHADGMKAASVNFFTGQRNFPVPPADSTDVNPVLKVYFQGDVYEMNRLTDPDGKSRERWRYFQRRIKFALAEQAEVTPVKITFDGREYAARQIAFQPYKDDPKREAFDRFADKSYTVIVADDLPGYVYEVRSEVPGKEQGSPPLVRETLRIQSVQPYQQTTAGR
jgi:hypothetical protein